MTSFQVFLCVFILYFSSCSCYECNFNNYVIQFNKNYNEADYAKREQTFLIKCSEINYFNAGNHSYTKAVNNFTDMSDADLTHYLGLNPVDLSSIPVQNQASTDSLNLRVSSSVPPLSLDYNALGHISSIKNQGSCGCCWSFASIAMYEAVLSIKGFANYGLSQQASLECTSNYAPNRRKSDCSGGYFSDPLNFLAIVGSLLRTNYPYVAGNYGSLQGYPTTPGICADGNRVMLGSGQYQIYGNAMTSILIKTLLNDQGPLMVGVYADSGFIHYSGGVYSGCPANSQNYINHAVLLYGYDSSGNWLIKNQWGTGWGISGFMKLSSTNDCGMSYLLGNIQFSSINGNPNVVISDPTLLFANSSGKLFAFLSMMVVVMFLLL